MNTNVPGPRRSGFTLIELLTVLAIVGLLLAILLPSISAARVATQRAQTKARFAQWATAMELFRQEYGHYPLVSRAGKLDPERFAAALLGRSALSGEPLEESANADELAGNVKRLAFYSLEPAEVSDDGAALVDAFGNSDIAVRVDWNGDGRIGPEDTLPGESAAWPPVGGASGAEWAPPAETMHAGGRVLARVVFYSAGRGQSASDLVLSWR